ncbi:MAG: hypothetical protein IJY36_07885 [Coprobacter sp.]|nr:hypothetical protein [Coprobacter sp.]
MRKILFCVFILIPFFTNAQIYKMYQTRNVHNQLRLNTANGEVRQIQDDGQSWIICYEKELLGKTAGRFCLYETQNMWNFIMLDTYTGKNWQVQYSVEGPEYMFATPINQYSLAYPSSTSLWTNRFQMFATKNMWNFIMLDTYEGRLWQVQYSADDMSALVCIPINSKPLVSTRTKPSFSIQPLVSMYQYYLIDEMTGNMWKFQWSTEGDDYRWIERFR